MGIKACDCLTAKDTSNLKIDKKNNSNTANKQKPIDAQNFKEI